MLILKIQKNVNNMARERKLRQGHPAIALIVDGKDEKWYVDRVKEHYPCTALKAIKIKPELPERKKIQDLFDLAKGKLEEEYTFVVLIIDLDEPLKDINEFNKFKELYTKYVAAQSNSLVGRQKSNYDWMKNLLLIVNNPCLEYWYLLHYSKTTKFFSDFAALSPTLHKIPDLSEYEKCERYYNNHPDIYERLNKNNGLTTARTNAIPFDLGTCTNQGCSGMNLMFDYFDKL